MDLLREKMFGTGHEDSSMTAGDSMPVWFFRAPSWGRSELVLLENQQDASGIFGK